MGRKRQDPIQRILDRVEGDLCEEQCWNTTGYKNKDGYSMVWIHPTYVSSHRIMWEVHNGCPVPPGMVIRHKCDNTSCVNPNHLETGTQKQNQRDKVDRNRSLKGTKHPKSILNEEKVREIRQRLDQGEQPIDICDDYGVTRFTISKIKRRVIWGWLD